jgi:hypothetical protein
VNRAERNPAGKAKRATFNGSRTLGFHSSMSETSTKSLERGLLKLGCLAILAAIVAGILLTSVGESKGQQSPGFWERALLGPPLGIAAWGLVTSALWASFGPSDDLSLLGLVFLLGLGVLC